MASVRQRDGTKFWFACITLPNGRRVQRSTKETDRKKAQQIADKWEAVTRGRVTARQTQKVIADLYRAITGEHLVFPTVREYFNAWVARKKPETAPSTYRFYHDKAQRFLNWLGNRADQQIALVSREDILAFRADELERVAPCSVNHAIKFLRMVFKTANEDGKHHEENPAIGVKVAKLRDGNRRRGFTIPEIKRILKIANNEWRSLIYFGLYSGQRLGDLARLTWQNVDLDRDEIRFVSRKTGRTMIIPIASPLRKQIEEQGRRNRDIQRTERGSYRVAGGAIDRLFLCDAQSLPVAWRKVVRPQASRRRPGSNRLRARKAGNGNPSVRTGIVVRLDRVVTGIVNADYGIIAFQIEPADD